MPDKKTDLYQRAEAKVSHIPEDLDTLSPEETRKILNELRVHQIELEMQTDELLRTQEKLESVRARYFALYDFAPVGYVTISEQGIILEANLAAAALLGAGRGALIKQPFSRFVLKEDQDIYYLNRKGIFEKSGVNLLQPNSAQTGELHTCELRMVKMDGNDFWAHLEAAVGKDENGTIVCHIVISDVTNRKEVEEEIRRNESRLKRLVDILQHPSATIQDFLDYALDQAIQMTGSNIGYIYHYHEDRQEFILNTWSKEVMAECTVTNRQAVYELDKTGIWGEAVRQRRPIVINDFQTAHPQKKGYPEGHVQLLKFMTVPIFKDHSIVGVVGLANKETDYEESDILQVSLLMEAVWKVTERKRAEEMLHQEKIFTEALLESIPGMLYVYDMQGNFIKCNKKHEEMTGYSVEELSLMNPLSWYDNEEDIIRVKAAINDVFTKGYGEVEAPMRIKSGDILSMRFNGVRLILGEKTYFVGVGIDITEQKRAEEEKAKVEYQLQQAHKMESVGRLAGGVAHDFNNMLGVIIGHTEMAMEQVYPAQPLHADLQEIRTAANRSADLTRQLLTFARKQTVAPKILDLNRTVAGMLKMLQRLIGENILLEWHPDANLWPVKVDPSQIDQILANLCVNARDAISDVGKMTIETGNAIFDEDYCTANAGFTPGEYVLLAVSDNGFGMDKETLSHLFEPFYTTKILGKGTGLGLATVYGIIRQNNGFVNVYSEPDQGTTFKIYLPRHVGTTAPLRTKGPADADSRGFETILLVEDEPAILAMTTKMLERQGYTVLAASTPGEAIRLARERASEIQLLMTDVVMPEMNGRDLAKTLMSLCPNIKRLFMSGYTANVIAHHGVLDDGVCFIQKPFSVKALAAKVREVLDQISTDS